MIPLRSVQFAEQDLGESLYVESRMKESNYDAETVIYEANTTQAPSLSSLYGDSNTCGQRQYQRQKQCAATDPSERNGYVLF